MLDAHILLGSRVFLAAAEQGQPIQAAPPADSSLPIWFVTGVFAVLATMIWWFMRGKFADLHKYLETKFAWLKETDERIEEGLNKVKHWSVAMNKRVVSIEQRLGGGFTEIQSPVRLNDLGQQILRDSGIMDAADCNREKLLKKISDCNPETAYDVQDATRKIFQEFDFGDEHVKRLKDYCFKEGTWRLKNLYDIGAIYFRDIALEVLGFNIKDLNNESDGEQETGPEQDDSPEPD